MLPETWPPPARSSSQVAPQGGFLFRVHVKLLPTIEASMGRLLRLTRFTTTYIGVPRPASHAERQITRHNLPLEFWAPGRPDVRSPATLKVLSVCLVEYKDKILWIPCGISVEKTAGTRVPGERRRRRPQTGAWATTRRASPQYRDEPRHQPDPVRTVG